MVDVLLEVVLDAAQQLGAIHLVVDNVALPFPAPFPRRSRLLPPASAAVMTKTLQAPMPTLDQRGDNVNDQRGHDRTQVVQDAVALCLERVDAFVDPPRQTAMLRWRRHSCSSCTHDELTRRSVRQDRPSVYMSAIDSNMFIVACAYSGNTKKEVRVTARRTGPYMLRMLHTKAI